jgi:hypothetical protein
MKPSGFFAGWGDAGELLSVVRGLELTQVGQVHQSLFNPDLLREGLVGDPNREVQQAAKVINLEKIVDSGPATVVVITSLPQAQSSLDLITLQALVTDRGKGIGRIEWRVKGITAAVAAKPASAGSDYQVTQQLALDPGENTIEVVA